MPSIDEGLLLVTKKSRNIWKNVVWEVKKIYFEFWKNGKIKNIITDVHLLNNLRND